VVALLIPFVLFMGLLVKRPEVLLLENDWGMNRTKNYAGNHYDEKIMDELLEKVGKNELNSLSHRERKKLEELSKALK